MRTRDEILSDIKSTKLKKAIAGIIAIIAVVFGLKYQVEQGELEKELLILDQGKLDQMILK